MISQTFLVVDICFGTLPPILAYRYCGGLNKKGTLATSSGFKHLVSILAVSVGIMGGSALLGESLLLWVGFGI